MVLDKGGKRMGFFSGSSTSVVKPLPELFDAGIFSGKKQNVATKQLAEQFKGTLEGGAFLQDPAILNQLIQQLASGGSFLSDPERGNVLDQAQAQFNKRGLSRITENEALAALAPFEIAGRQEATSRLAGLTSARGFDLDAFFKLILESRPDLLVGSTTTGSSSPSGLAKLSGLLSVGQQGVDLFGPLLSPAKTGSLQGPVKPA